MVAIFRVGAQDLELAIQYFDHQEYEKAYVLYHKLAKNANNHAKIHRNYLTTLTQLHKHNETEKYLKRGMRKNPIDPTFHIDYGLFLIQQKKQSGAEKHFQAYLDRIQHKRFELANAARMLMNKGLFSYAEKLYFMGQKNTQQDYSFQLAHLYAVSGKTDKMIDTYLKILNTKPHQTEYIQGILRNRLGDERDFTKLRLPLLQYIQKYPDKIVYNKMLVWFYIQQRQFKKAFFQARAVDHREQQKGVKLYEIGELALESKNYQVAIDIYTYLVKTYRNQQIYPRAKKRLVNAREELVKNTYPVNRQAIKSLVHDYQKVIEELGLIHYTAEAARNLALLQAFYLDNRDTAIIVLESLVRRPHINKSLIAKAKLDMGDIYMLKEEPWESSLLYSQVEKSQKNTNLGHLAKLKNAKLSYYQGDFELSKAHLDILKLATSREIANDAMQLSLLIGDNLALDTSDTALKRYAKIDLMVFQGKYKEALHHYDQMLSDFRGHSLTDEIYWQQANIYLKLGKFHRAIDDLTKIMEQYADDIYADNANFMLGKIYEEHLKDQKNAMKYYENQMINFPGSIHTAEARKRFRKLRGDRIN